MFYLHSKKKSCLFFYPKSSKDLSTLTSAVKINNGNNKKYGPSFPSSVPPKKHSSSKVVGNYYSNDTNLEDALEGNADERLLSAAISKHQVYEYVNAHDFCHKLASDGLSHVIRSHKKVLELPKRNSTSESIRNSLPFARNSSTPANNTGHSSVYNNVIVTHAGSDNEKSGLESGN